LKILKNTGMKVIGCESSIIFLKNLDYKIIIMYKLKL